MDTKTINAIARTLKRTMPKPKHFFDNALMYDGAVAQWTDDVISIGYTIQRQSKDFDYVAFLVKCGYER